MSFKQCLAKGDALIRRTTGPECYVASYYFFVVGNIDMMKRALQLAIKHHAVPSATVEQKSALIDLDARNALLSVLLVDHDFEKLNLEEIRDDPSKKPQLVNEVAAKGIPENVAETVVSYILNNRKPFATAIRLAGISELKQSIGRMPVPRCLYATPFPDYNPEEALFYHLSEAHSKAFLKREKNTLQAITEGVTALSECWGLCRDVANNEDLVQFSRGVRRARSLLEHLTDNVSSLWRALDAERDSINKKSKGHH